MTAEFTKTLPHLYKYRHSRKTGNYNGTIIFEIDIMKKSSPLNSKFTFFATVKTKNSLYAQQKTAETITNKTNKTFTGEDFFMISISEIMVPL